MASWRRKLALLLSSTILALLAAEVLARLFLDEPEIVEVTVEPRSTAGAASGRADVEAEGVPETLYLETAAGRRLRPNVRAVIRNHRLNGREVVLETNAFGHRHRDLAVEKTIPRVLFLGDSITLADYLPDDETFVRRVERLAAAEGFPIEAVNAGVGAIGVEEELAILLETGFATRPDVVVLGFYLNDVQPSRGVRLHLPPRWLEWSLLARHLWRFVSVAAADRGASSIPREEVDSWRSELEQRFGTSEGLPATSVGRFHAGIVANAGDWGSAWAGGAWRRIRPVVERIEAEVRSRGLDLAVVVHPVLDQVELEFVEDQPQRTMADLAGELGVPCLDLLPTLRAEFARPGPSLFHDHCHHTREGSEIVARAMWAFLRFGLTDGAGRRER